MTILGIETSTAVCSVGLIRSGNPSIEYSLVESHIHSEKLQTLIQDVMKKAGASPWDIDAVAVSVGPGSFTGLRIGLSTAKGLCFSLEKPLLAIPTFEVIAAAAARRYNSFERFLIALDAKQSEFYTGSFVVTRGLVEIETDVAVRSFSDIGQEAKDGRSTLLLTDAPSAVSRMPQGLFQIEHVHDFCRGEVVASMGARKYEQNDFSDISSVEPSYLKDFVVRTQELHTHA